MRRNTLIKSLLICAILMALISYLTTINPKPEQFDHQTLKTALLRKWYSRHHTFIPAGDQDIKYDGRWMRSSNLVRYEASFAGASFTFTVYNTTWVQIALSNALSPEPRLDPADRKSKDSQMVLTPAKTRSARAGPVDIVVSNSSSSHALRYNSARGIVMVAQDLDRADTHTFKITLGIQRMPGTIQFEGVWIEQGGHLSHLTAGTKSTARAQIKDENRSASSAERQEAKRHSQLVEIMAPSTMLRRKSMTDISAHSDILWPHIWSNLLETQFVNTTMSLIPIPPSSCITRRCQSTKTKNSSNTLQMASEIFFRAGSPGTDLYRRLWPFGSSPGGITSSAALVLILGIADIEAFLNAGSRSKNDVDRFTDEFGRTYSNFIQTIRRTAYLSASPATHQMLDASYPEMTADESFLYNSAPSTFPIFLVLQPLPSHLVYPQARSRRALLHHATNKVVSELKWHIGDKKTFVVDTAGWLTDEDFQQASEATAGFVSQCSLTQRGHIKFAHHMSLHLCHYLLDRITGKTQCQFDRHDDYVGTLYVPETAGFGKILEEKRVQKIKEMFGIL